MTKFIGIYENAFSKEYCDRAINYFEASKNQGATYNRQQIIDVKRTAINDEFMFASNEENINPSGNCIREFNEVFWKIYHEQYAVDFAVLKDCAAHNNFAYKIQKTQVGGGYHIWHFESSAREFSTRLLTWMVYLNDVDSGGETEFLYQHLRVVPKAGTLVIWPAAFTHTHRGNPPLSNDKYIITGWTEF